MFLISSHNRVLLKERGYYRKGVIHGNTVRKPVAFFSISTCKQLTNFIDASIRMNFLPNFDTQCATETRQRIMDLTRYVLKRL